MPIWLKPQADRPARRRHPWIFSGAVAKTTDKPQPGDVVQILDHQDQFVAWGHYSASAIAVRLLDWQAQATVDRDWWTARLHAALDRRGHLLSRPDLNACRLVHGEADLLPGLVVDWYNGWAVLQASTPGIDRVKGLITEILMSLLPARGIYERSDMDSRRLEGLKPSLGSLVGPAPPGPVTITENSFQFQVDLIGGQKTGFFLDQRDNRRKVAAWANGRDVLDCFAYTHGFSVYCLAAGAKSVVRVESSAEAVALGGINLEINGLADSPGQTIIGDVFKVLRQFRDQDRSFDLIIVDPPKLAPTRAQVSKASRAYKDVNLLALKLLRPGGILATFSCSGGVGQDLFQKILFGAAVDAGRQVQVVDRLGPGADHPVLLSFPESDYLKGLIAMVVAD